MSNDLKTTTIKKLHKFNYKKNNILAISRPVCFVLLCIETDKGSHQKQWGCGSAGPNGVSVGVLAPVASMWESWPQWHQCGRAGPSGAEGEELVGP